jgi:hypothetical protein
MGVSCGSGDAMRGGEVQSSARKVQGSTCGYQFTSFSEATGGCFIAPFWAFERKAILSELRRGMLKRSDALIASHRRNLARKALRMFLFERLLRTRLLFLLFAVF